MVYHSDDKVHRYAQEDPATALYSMHACILELLSIHFLHPSLRLCRPGATTRYPLAPTCVPLSPVKSRSLRISRYHGSEP